MDLMVWLPIMFLTGLAGMGVGLAFDDARTALAPCFTFERHQPIRRVVCLDADSIGDVMIRSYGGLRASQRACLAVVGRLEVTFSRDALLSWPRRPR